MVVAPPPRMSSCMSSCISASFLRALSLGLVVLAAACAAPSDGEDEGSTESAIEAGSKGLAIGWNGKSDQFAAMALFRAAEGKNGVGPKLCHNYIQWNVGEEKAGGDAKVVGSRAYWEDWLAKANPTCDETLISFKGRKGAAPGSARFKQAMEAFFAIDWRSLTGYKGTFTYAAWNEANNPADDGNGLGMKIEPDLAARYHMIVEEQCKLHGNCVVAAGDFASNGQMDEDYNPTPTSYLGKYKATIAAEAGDYALPKGYVPRVFAFHGWHDINSYTDQAKPDHCNVEKDCLTKRIVKSLSGAWSAVEIWDTEVGAGQFKELGDDDQACAAAYLLRMTSNLTPRITRLYYTHAKGGVGRLYDGATPRPAAAILAARAQSAAPRACK